MHLKQSRERLNGHPSFILCRHAPNGRRDKEKALGCE
jgi:hypothetical protein